MTDKQTKSDLFTGVWRQQEGEQTHEWDDRGRQNHVDDVVQWTTMQVHAVRYVYGWPRVAC